MRAAKPPTSISLYAYYVLKDGPICKIFGMKIDIDSHHKIAFTLIVGVRVGLALC